MIFRMAWRNVWRNPRRSVLTAAAIAFACTLLIFMLSFQFGSYAAMINASVKINTGHLQIQAAGYQATGDIRRVVEMPRSIKATLEALPQVTTVAPRAAAFSLVSSDTRSYGVMVVGVDPARERQGSRIADLVHQGAFLQADEPAGAVIGHHLAAILKVRPGDQIVLLGQGRDGSMAANLFEIKGIFRSGMDRLDRTMVYIPLATFQATFSMDEAVHQLVVMLDDLEDVAAVREAFSEAARGEPHREDLRVLDWTELQPGLKESIQLDLISGAIFYLVLVVVVAFSIMNTFLMAVMERTREFGVMTALGTTPGRLLRLVLTESCCLTLVGLIAGMTAGALVTLYFQHHGIDLAGAAELLGQFGISGRMYPRLSALSLAIGPLLVLAITLLAALVPALRVSRLRPVEALVHT